MINFFDLGYIVLAKTKKQRLISVLLGSVQEMGQTNFIRTLRKEINQMLLP